MKFDKPYLSFDFETTGTNFEKDRVVSIHAILSKPDGTSELFSKTINPGIRIPDEASKIHGITNEMVLSAPTFKEVSSELYNKFFSAEYYVGYNIRRFDVPMAVYEFERCGLKLDWTMKKIIDPFIIFSKREPRTLEGALRFYCGEKLENAHSAVADVMATVKVAGAQLSMYDISFEHAIAESTDDSIVDLAGKIKKDRNGEYVFTFGKEKGIPIRNCRDFANWVLRSDFPEDTKKILRGILN